jgi:hypothetical protein
MFRHLQKTGDPGAAPVNDPAPCGDDPAAALKTMFVDLTLGPRVDAGQVPVLRPVFLKAHGVCAGTFTVRPDLPEDLRVGIFARDCFPAWIRFSSDTLPTLPDLKSLGIGVKLFGVPGRKLLEPDTQATTHDFLMQNHDVFFVDTAKDMCEFTHFGVFGPGYEAYLKTHPKTRQILDDMSKVVPSVLATAYWGVLPYRFGAERYVKYKLVPVDCAADAPPASYYDDPNYLAVDLRKRLKSQGAAFRFYVQFRKGDMPLDEATVRWEEGASEPVHVATLTLPVQDVSARGQAEYGENLAFNPWHALPEHAPVGSIAEARRVVYAASANYRRNANGVPLAEPVTPRPLEQLPPPRDTTIVRAAIHPAIGVARVGNSQDEFVLAPELPVPPPVPVGSSKDATGALKRQAARFRIYGYNASGAAVAELTSASADVTWTVHLANAKAAWYQFQIALDIPEAGAAADPIRRNTPEALALMAPPTQRRNKAEPDRSKLLIDPGPRSIRGNGTKGPAYAFDTGKFYDKPVYLGELQTDDHGRLIVLGGRGVSASIDGSPAADFANNDGWHDDVADGPVTATVTIAGRELPVEPAWVVVGPPNYAPDLQGVRTMYDLLEDIFIQGGWLRFPVTVSFTQHVLPILYRMSRLQWVNKGFAEEFGWGAANDLLSPRSRVRLGSSAPENAEVRRLIYNSFRRFERDGLSPIPWAWLYGDATNIPAVSARQYAVLTSTQMQILSQWAAGNFREDLDPAAPLPQALSDLPVNDQPVALDRAALAFCLADAFHPGCEMTWVVRHASMYSAPFRIRHRPPSEPEPDWGRELTPDKALAVNGPLYAQGPGGLSRWMAVPWQTDTSSCLSGYEPDYDPNLPAFWPAHVPNQVLRLVDYMVVRDTQRPREERLKAFRTRLEWLRGIGVKKDPYQQVINRMVTQFGKLGVLETREGVPDDADFPPVMLVESEPAFPPAPAVAVAMPGAAAAVAEPEPPAANLLREQVATGQINKLRRFKVDK